MKKTFLAAAVLTLLMAPAFPSTAAEAVKIGYVNMQRALENSAAGQQATKKLSDIWDKSKSELQKNKDRIEAFRAEIDKQSLLWNEKTKREKDDELRRMERDYNRLLKDVQDELKAKETEFSEGIGKDLLRIIEDIGKAEGYTIILEKKSSAVLYAPASIDLTDRVIKQYDSLKQ
jgi:outer membrane protein